MMTSLKRFPIKYIRDFIKKDYKIRDECYVCGSRENLELHHLYGLSELFDKWCISNKISDIDNVEMINQLREKFATDEKDKLSNKNLYTLCKTHHIRLHTLYGQRYPNYLASKIKNWLDIQKEKNGK
jgi:5-methylcytosine-specific restriction endonuclease McrA